MAKELRDYADSPIQGILIRAGSVDSVITIENRLLDGSFSVQTIGNASKEINIEFICERAALETLKLSTITKAPIRIIYDSDDWTGIIRGESLTYDYVLPISYNVKATILVNGD